MGGTPDLPARYEPVRHLGEGGSGSVWLCRDRSGGNRLVALKVVPPGSSLCDLLRSEFATLSALVHPNIPTAHGFEEFEGGGCGLSLEYVDGGTFVEAVSKRFDQFPELACEALHALSFIHDFGLVHRDLKPENLLVRCRPRNDTRLVMLDFGMAEQRTGSAAEVRGTLHYMAPELLEGAAPDIRTDLYALGILFQEALLGRHPIRSDPSSDLTAFLDLIRVPVERGEFPSDVPQEVVDWLNALRSHDPADRPSDAKEALARFGGILGTDVAMDAPAQKAARLASGPPPGRRTELETIRGCLSRGGLTTTFLIGEAGSGKTRILDSVTTEAVRNGWDVTTPGELAHDPIGSGSLTDAARRVLIVVDELEVASPDTTTLVDRLTRRPPADSIRVLAAGREEEIHDRRIRALLSEADFLPTVERIDLERLDENGVAEFLKRAIAVEPSEHRVRDYLKQSDGLPAVLEDLVVEGGHSGDAVERLQATIASKIRRLSPTAHKALLTIAVLGEPTEEEILEGILEDNEMLRSLDEIGVARLARKDHARWRPSSGLVQKLVLSLAGARPIEAVARNAIRALERAPRPDHAKLARLWRQAGDRTRASDYAARVGRRALGIGNPEAASEWLTQAILDLPKGSPRYGELRWELGWVSEKVEDYWKAAKSYAAVARCKVERAGARSYVLSLKARALTKTGRQRAAIRVARSAQACATTERERLIAVSVRGAAQTVVMADAEVGEILLKAARDLEALGEHRWASEAYYARALALDSILHFDAAHEAYGVAEAYAEGIGYHEVLINSLISRAIIDRNNGQLSAAASQLERAGLLAEQHGLDRQKLWILTSKGRTLELLGHFDRALAALEAIRLGTLLAGNREHYERNEVFIAEVLLGLGRPSQAVDRMSALLRTSTLPFIRTFASLTLVELLLHGDDPDAQLIARRLREIEAIHDKPKLAIFGVTILGLEYHAHFQESPPKALWKRFLELVSEEGSERTLLARGWLAWSKEQLRLNDWKAALDACVEALGPLQGRHHDLAAQVYLSMSKAHKLRGTAVEADMAFEKAQRELQTAAEMIEDEDFRSDFLARPVFRELRRKKETFSDAEERLAALYDMVHALNTGGDPEDRLGVILDQALRVVRAERGLILLRSEGDDQYQVRFSRNLEQETIEEAARFSRTAVLAAGKGESVLSVHTANDEHLERIKRVSSLDVTSLLCVPLRLHDELVGAVYVDNRSEGGVFKQQDLRFLEAFADHAALALESARDLRRLERRRERLRSATRSRARFGEIVGRSPGMQQVYNMIERVAESRLPVLIQGQSGTGKELVARETHKRSPRKDKPFLSENCAAIADDLLESELFGHVRGAFTGAHRDKAGLFEQADGGTLLLDEVGDMSAAMQARLLRVLQEGELRRVGDETRRHVDVRLITATHRDLTQRVAEGTFREDLLYRLQVLVIQLPPLNERAADIALLVDHFLDSIGKQRGRERITIRNDALELIERYAWPGNVRQLENALQRLALLAGDDAITRATIDSDPSLRATLIGQSGRPTLSLKQNERDRIAEALKQAGGNRADAAKLLGVSRATIFRKIKKFDLN